MIAQLLAFLGVSALVIVTPGPDTALTIRNTLLGGRGAGVFTALGVASGQALWTVAASAGVAALLVASAPAFVAVKLAGAAYLGWLGAQALLAAWRGKTRHVEHEAEPKTELPSRAAYRQGLLSNLGNPKMAVFFTSLLPQFAIGGDVSFLALVPLGLTFCLMTLAWLVAYATAVARARGFLQRPRIRRALDAVTAVVLVALGLRVAAERR
jgi:threonine/homoserine/homoserine lactone efflux protein